MKLGINLVPKIRKYEVSRKYLSTETISSKRHLFLLPSSSSEFRPANCFWEMKHILLKPRASPSFIPEAMFPQTLCGGEMVSYIQQHQQEQQQQRQCLKLLKPYEKVFLRANMNNNRNNKQNMKLRQNNSNVLIQGIERNSPKAKKMKFLVTGHQQIRHYASIRQLFRAMLKRVFDWIGAQVNLDKYTRRLMFSNILQTTNAPLYLAKSSVDKIHSSRMFKQRYGNSILKEELYRQLEVPKNIEIFYGRDINGLCIDFEFPIVVPLTSDVKLRVHVKGVAFDIENVADASFNISLLEYFENDLYVDLVMSDILGTFYFKNLSTVKAREVELWSSLIKEEAVKQKRRKLKLPKPAEFEEKSHLKSQ